MVVIDDENAAKRFGMQKQKKINRSYFKLDTFFTYILATVKTFFAKQNHT
jgi:hypothetical protein